MRTIILLMVFSSVAHAEFVGLCYGDGCTSTGIQVPVYNAPESEPTLAPQANPMYPNRGQGCMFDTDCGPSERCLIHRYDTYGICN